MYYDFTIITCIMKCTIIVQYGFIGMYCLLINKLKLKLKHIPTQKKVQMCDFWRPGRSSCGVTSSNPSIEESCIQVRSDVPGLVMRGLLEFLTILNLSYLRDCECSEHLWIVGSCNCVLL